MHKIISNYKQNTTLPTYNDGKADIYEIIQDSSKDYPCNKLKSINKFIYFNEISVTDKIKILASDKAIEITKKITIPQTKEIHSNMAFKINDTFYKVFNTYHYVNKDGILQTDISLTDYLDEVLYE